AIHGRIARFAEPSGLLAASSLTRHFELAGDFEKAAAHAAIAGAEAEAALAFDFAATMYARVVALEPENEATLREARRGRARSLYLAGRCAEAGAAFLEAARTADRREARDLERQAVEAYLSFGHVAEALAVLEPLLAAEGMPFPKTQGAIVYHAAKSILGVRAHTTRAPRPSARPDPEAAARSDLALSAGKGLTNIAPAQGVVLTLSSLIFALRSGDAFRISRGLSLAGTGFAPGLADVGERYLAWASEIAERQDDDHLRVIHLVSDGTRGFVLGDWDRCLESSTKGLALAARTAAPTSWEEAIANTFTCAAYEYKGDLVQMESRSRENLRGIRERGNRINQVMVVSGLGYTLAARHASEALDEVIDEMQRLMADWTVPFPFWEAFRLRLRCLRALCWGDPLGALALIEEHWPKLEEHRLLTLPVISAPIHCVRSAVMLEAAARGLVPRRVALRDAKRSARILDRAERAEGPAAAAIARASIAHQRSEDAERDRHLAHAIEIAREAKMGIIERMAGRALAL
ncbi:MAG: hypothetical protein H5U40_03900, partial [Polyangiaceae bacterium]|nr:hypothetical protein [Polyangiaceae bacterium]